jgi:hypothetical protein
VREENGFLARASDISRRIGPDSKKQKVEKKSETTFLIRTMEMTLPAPWSPIGTPVQESMGHVHLPLPPTSPFSLGKLRSARLAANAPPADSIRTKSFE